MMVQKPTCMSRIFGKDKVDQSQRLQRTERNIIEVTDRSRDEIEHSVTGREDVS